MVFSVFTPCGSVRMLRCRDEKGVHRANRVSQKKELRIHRGYLASFGNFCPPRSFAEPQDNRSDTPRGWLRLVIFTSKSAIWEGSSSRRAIDFLDELGSFRESKFSSGRHPSRLGGQPNPSAFPSCPQKGSAATFLALVPPFRAAQKDRALSHPQRATLGAAHFQAYSNRIATGREAKERSEDSCCNAHADPASRNSSQGSPRPLS